MPSRPAYSPLLPPRQSFVDAGHFAAALSLLDAQDRLQMAEVSHGDARLEYALWARRAAGNVPGYLYESRLRDRGGRPEWSRGSLMARGRDVIAKTGLILGEFEGRFGKRPMVVFCIVEEQA